MINAYIWAPFWHYSSYFVISLIKNQILNTKCQPTSFDIVTTLKDKRMPCFYFFEIVTVTQNGGWHLVFHIRLLVNSWCNEKNIYSIKFAYLVPFSSAVCRLIDRGNGIWFFERTRQSPIYFEQRKGLVMR